MRLHFNNCIYKWTDQKNLLRKLSHVTNEKWFHEPLGPEGNRIKVPISWEGNEHFCSSIIYTLEDGEQMSTPVPEGRADQRGLGLTPRRISTLNGISRFLLPRLQLPIIQVEITEQLRKIK